MMAGTRAIRTDTKLARIEALWARGMSAQKIAPEVGATLDYVQFIIRKIQAHSKPIRPEGDANHDERHLRLIKAKHGASFPFYAHVPI